MLKNADLIAPDGMIYTDGKGVYATMIWLGEGVSENSFNLISKEEYKMIIETEELDADSI